MARGRAELIVEAGGEDRPCGHRPGIEQIDRITRTMRQLLDFSRVEPADGRRAAGGPADVSELLRFERSESGWPRLEIARGPPPLRAQPDELEQVLLNLLLNACHASRDRGRIVIRAPRDLADDALQLVCIVDFGVGIPAHLRPRVFDPFFTTKKRGQGTGLGLTIGSRCPTNHGGRLDLESEEEAGTRVLLWWPTTR